MKLRAGVLRPSRKTAAITAVLVGMVAFLVLMGIGLLNKAPVTGRSGVTRVNKPAPEFTLPLLTGGELALSEHLGQPIVINFWASWCPPCRLEAPALERAWRAYREQGVMFVGVEVQDTEEVGRAYLSEFGITYPSGLDSDGTITVDYGVIGLPVTFFINDEGVVARRWVGALTGEALFGFTGDLVAGVTSDGEADASDGEAGAGNPDDFFLLEGDR